MVTLILLAVGATAVLAATVPTAVSAAAPPYGTSSSDTMATCPTGTVDCPASDPFYRAPANLDSLKDGTLIASRPATVAEPGMSSLEAAYTISYRSEDAFGRPVMDTATVLIPNAPYAGASGRPLVSEQYAEDSLGAQCQPSYALAHPNTNSNVDAESASVDEFLGQGYVVVAPDFEGPAEQYIVGQQEGHATLDGIRAALTLPQAQLAAKAPVALNGYSGGAHATAWADELASSYAPELNIIGAAEGGTPADLTATANYLNGTVFFSFVLLSDIGLDRGFPAAGIYGDLNAKGRAVYSAFSDACVNTATGQYAYDNENDFTSQPNASDTPKIKALLAHEKLGQAAPKFPILDYHVVNDELVPYGQDQQLAEYYCSQHTPVQFVPITGDHISGEVVGEPLVQAFLKARLNGVPPVNDCGEISSVPVLQIPPVAAPGSTTTGGTSSNSGVACTQSDTLTHIRSVHITKGEIKLRGIAEPHCGERITTVGIAIAAVHGKRCSFLKPNHRFGKPGSCAPRDYLRAKGTAQWSFLLKQRLPRGVYYLWEHAVDSKGHTTRNTPRKHVFFRVRLPRSRSRQPLKRLFSRPASTNFTSLASPESSPDVVALERCQHRRCRPDLRTRSQRKAGTTLSEPTALLFARSGAVRVESSRERARRAGRRVGTERRRSAHSRRTFSAAKAIAPASRGRVPLARAAYACRVPSIRMASVRSLFIQTEARGSPIANATGFVSVHQDGLYLVTNWHVLAGRRLDDGSPLAQNGAVPDSLTIWHNVPERLGSWISKTVPLYGTEGHPLWLEHPVHGRSVDVVGLPLTITPDVITYPYDPANPGPEVLASPSNPVSVIGFPFGVAGTGRLAIWTQGTIASEVELDFEDLPCFLIDSRTRVGQSGAPVLLYRVGSYLGEDGGLVLGGGEIERFVGVYSGRIHPESDLGRVWKRAALLEILDAQRRGLFPVVGPPPAATNPN